MDRKVERDELSERALRLKLDVSSVLNHPSARILPAAVVRLIDEQASIVAALAAEVHDLRAGGQRQNESCLD